MAWTPPNPTTPVECARHELDITFGLLGNFAPKLDRFEAAVRAEAAEDPRVRLWLIEQYVARITADDHPVAIGLDLTPWLDGPIHRDDVAAYKAAHAVQDRPCGCSARFTRHADGCPTLTAASTALEG